ncbi:MAG TPA: FAD-binding oxidoreductase [Gemmatimonadales bacterium]|nr:FAD-binding oxidoreductase [Gemmatimonadales bacterium]
MSLVAKTIDGGSLPLEAGLLQTLRAGIRGQVLLSGEPGYEESRSLWNAMIERRPGLVVRCLGTADVMAALDFARQHQLLVSVKGGGHNIAGLAACDGGLMLDLGPMRGVWVDPERRVARAQGGCLLGDVDRETQLHGLAAVLGFVSNTGIGGLTLGGGFGYLTRRYGWTCDNLRSMEVVTPDGRLVRANENEHPDLFWGLRGGGGNFGVVTSFDYTLYPVGPEIVAGAVAWPAELAPQVLELYRRIAAEAPPELACIAVLRIAPPAPWIAKEAHGKPIVAIFACHSGPVAEGERLTAPIKAFGSPVGDVLQRRSYVSQQSLLDATQPKGRRYYWKSEYLPGISPDLLAGAIEHAGRIESPHSAIVLFPIDGALNRLSPDHSPAGNRDAKLVLNITAAWEKPEEDRSHIGWARAAWEDLRRFSTGGTYINFQTEDEGEDRTRAAYGDNYRRLVEVKRKWDPANRFRMNKNIPPDA